MKKKLLYGLFFIAVFLLLSGVVMFLWNSLLPPLLHVTVISYWQALGLMVLCRVLFGSLSLGRWGGDGPRRTLKDKLMMMEDGDRAVFKEEWRKRCERREDK